ncbi:MAG: hypothetical protein ABW168_29825 [Sedimenticola sp.]
METVEKYNLLLNTLQISRLAWSNCAFSGGGTSGSGATISRQPAEACYTQPVYFQSLFGVDQKTFCVLSRVNGVLVNADDLPAKPGALKL